MEQKYIEIVEKVGQKDNWAVSLRLKPVKGKRKSYFHFLPLFSRWKRMRFPNIVRQQAPCIVPDQNGRLCKGQFLGIIVSPLNCFDLSLAQRMLINLFSVADTPSQ